MNNTDKILEYNAYDLRGDWDTETIEKVILSQLNTKLKIKINQAIAEERERVVGEIKEFRCKYRNLNVSSEFDIAFDNFLYSLQDINPKE